MPRKWDSENTDSEYGDWRDYAIMAGKAILARLWTLQVLPFLVLGAAFVSTSTGHLKDTWQQHTHLESLTQESKALVTRAWWHLDIDHTQLDAATTNWPWFTTPTFCVRLETEADQSGVACARHPAGLEYDQAAYQLRALSHSPYSGTPVPWQDGGGNLALELLIPNEGWTWLNETIYPHSFPYNWTPLEPRDEDRRWSNWDEFRSQLARPADDLVALWSQPATIDVLVDPGAPSRIMPVAFLRNQNTGEITPILVFVGIFGSVFWIVGLQFLLFDQTKRTRVLVAVISLILAPFWGQWIWRGLDYMLDHASDVGYFFTTMLPRSSVLETLPSNYFPADGNHVHTYTMRQSVYGPLFDGIRLETPKESLSEEAALTFAQTQVSQMIDSLSPQQRAERFALLACFAATGLKGAGGLFTASAETWKNDPQAGRLAALFLEYQANHGYPNHGLRCEQLMPG